jgi:hypothetical protein
LLDREDVVFVVAGFPSGRDKEIKPVKSLFCFPEGAKASRILLSRILFDLDEDDALVDAKIGGES